MKLDIVVDYTLCKGMLGLSSAKFKEQGEAWAIVAGYNPLAKDEELRKFFSRLRI